MSSKKLFLILLLLMIGAASQAFAQATVTAVPQKVPKGAYVNGPLGAADDNFFWQFLTITTTADQDDAGGATITITLPAGMNVALVDDSGPTRGAHVSIATDDVDVDFTTAPPTATASTITLTLTDDTAGGTGILAAGSKVYVMFPVTTLPNPPVGPYEYLVAFSDDASDDVATGEGPTITYVDPAPNALALVTFTDVLTGSDSTAVDGEVYPDLGVDSHSALADYIYDDDGTASDVESTVLGSGGVALYDLSDDLDDRDMRYRYYAAMDSTLSHITRDDTGVITLENYSISAAPQNTQNYSVEGSTGNRGLTVSNLPEGVWYIYIVSTLTGDFPLGRSGPLTVFHEPLVDVLAWDFDADQDLIAVNDNKNMTIDSGLYRDTDDTIDEAGNPTDNVDIWLAVDDHDDDAVVSLFYSTKTDLDDADIITSGSAPDMVVTGLTDAVAIVDSLLENAEDENGFIVYNWNITPTTSTLVAAGEYTLYAVANDGKHAHVLASLGFDATNAPSYSGTTQQKMTVRHSPDLIIDSLDEYNLGTDTGDDATVTVDIAQTDVVMISWGKGGIDGDIDVDDACTIEFYIDYDTGADNVPDYGSADYSALRTAASSASSNSATGTHKIHVTPFYEDNDSKVASYYAWDLKEDWMRTGWAPMNETAGEGYHIYAIISEGESAADTRRVVCLGITGVFDNAGAPPTPAAEVEFLNNTYARLYDPPISGRTVTADQTFRLNLESFDINANTQIGVFLANVNAREVLTNGDFEAGDDGSWTLGADWAITDGYAVKTGGGVTTLASNSGQTDGASAYTLTVVISNRTAGNIVVASEGGTDTGLDGVAAGSRTFATNGTWQVSWTSAGGADNIEFTPSADFDGRIESVSLEITSGAYTVGNMTTTITALSAYENGMAFALTSDDGDPANQVTYKWLEDDSLAVHPYYDVQLRIPGSATARYVDDINGSGTGLSDGTYYVYIGGDENNNSFADGDEILYRSPGTITITGTGTASSQRNLMLEPRRFISTIGDTTTVYVRMADDGNDVDLVDAFISVDMDLFDVVNSDTTPFTDPAGYGSMLANEAIADSANGRWILHTTLFNSGNPLNPVDTGFGSAVASFMLVGKGTASDTGESTPITFMNEGVYRTRYVNDNVDLGFSTSQLTAEMMPRGSVHGTIQFQGRTSAAQVVNFELRQRGSYEPSTDAVFIAANDGFVMATQTIGLADSIYSPDGIQYQLNSDGDFKLSNVPTGNWELFVYYERYLAKSFAISMNPGLDSLFIDMGLLRGGDSYGYTDVNNDAFPNNAINQDDVNRIAEAFGSTPDSSRWATSVNPTTGGKYNYKWSDIDEDGIVGVTDLTMATGNYTGGAQDLGAQPVYQKPTEVPGSNLDALVELVNAPTQLVAGQTYSVQIAIIGAADVKGYYLDLDYDSNALTIDGIVKGDFIDEMSFSFPVFSNDGIGLVNAVYGQPTFMGDGVLAELYFTAATSGAFSPDMIGITSAQLVDSSYQDVNLAGDDPSTSVETEEVPSQFVLTQNFPNPFNPTTMINFSVPTRGHVELKVYDSLGRSIKTLVSGAYEAGNYSVMWDATDASGNLVANGMYFYMIRANGFSESRKMMFLK